MRLFQREELWSTCEDSAEVSIWHIKDASKPFHRLVLPDCGACHCLIKVKNQVSKHMLPPYRVFTSDNIGNIEQ